MEAFDVPEPRRLRRVFGLDLLDLLDFVDLCDGFDDVFNVWDCECEGSDIESCQYDMLYLSDVLKFCILLFFDNNNSQYIDPWLIQ